MIEWTKVSPTDDELVDRLNELSKNGWRIKKIIPPDARIHAYRWVIIAWKDQGEYL